LRDKRFPKKNHLLKSAEFRNVFNKGKKTVTASLVFHVLRTDLGETRLGLAVSRKVGNAVIRNFVKRRIREAFRDSRGSFTESYDIVVYPRRGILEKDFQDYQKSFDQLLNRVRKARH